MKILETISNNAWMIRNDGKAIPVVQHIYANVDELYETLYAAEWLYNNTGHSLTEDVCIKLIAAYGASLNSEGSDIISNIIKDIHDKPYKFLSESFVNSVRDKLLTVDVSTCNIDKLASLVEAELNQEFLRARYGGLYNTSSSSREMVFRISSVGFNWYNIIWQFVWHNKSRIDSVTIVRDEESTGMKGYVYKSHKGLLYDRMPIDYFLEESGNPEVESLNSRYLGKNTITESISTNLAEASNIGWLLENISINSGRLSMKLRLIEQLEHCVKLENWRRNECEN